MHIFRQFAFLDAQFLVVGNESVVSQANSLSVLTSEAVDRVGFVFAACETDEKLEQAVKKFLVLLLGSVTLPDVQTRNKVYMLFIFASVLIRLFDFLTNLLKVKTDNASYTLVIGMVAGWWGLKKRPFVPKLNIKRPLISAPRTMITLEQTMPYCSEASTLSVVYL